MLEGAELAERRGERRRKRGGEGTPKIQALLMTLICRSAADGERLLLLLKLPNTPDIRLTRRGPKAGGGKDYVAL